MNTLRIDIVNLDMSEKSEVFYMEGRRGNEIPH